ncbi:TetR family transcriptional regulator [Planotetraspora thailandica]|uniref:TetR family transcriptional regulator n=1 Tax=Planotetraspora thailandica TaxID=487172 RepID=A0A8J3V8T8_9ACTN|nr:TetR/AcrR family transcriptional regulator [Planotetraspora thailandica]GII56144.1 TetR family transcriptional regulator [Planotetraspora thailandica]
MARPSMRKEIVDAALAQFHERGYNAAGVKDITDRAGVPKGSFYNHFASKEALAIVALQMYGEGRRLEEVTDPGTDPLTRLRSHFEFLRDEVVEQGFTHGCLIGNFTAEIADHSDAIRDAVQEAFATWAATIAATIAEAQGAGAVRAGLDPEQTARYILSTWEGTIVMARAERSRDAFDTFFELTFGTLLAR